MHINYSKTSEVHLSFSLFKDLKEKKINEHELQQDRCVYRTPY